MNAVEAGSALRGMWELEPPPSVGEFRKLCRNLEHNHLSDDLNEPRLFSLYCDQSINRTNNVNWTIIVFSKCMCIDFEYNSVIVLSAGRPPLQGVRFAPGGRRGKKVEGYSRQGLGAPSGNAPPSG